MGQNRAHFVMVTRQPTGQDLVCLVCHKQAQDIDHVVNRGSGGSKARDVPENKVPLCRECHELKTKGRIETKVWDVNPGEWLYLWRRKFADMWITTPVVVSQRYKCLVGRLSDGAEEDTGEASPVLTEPSASSLKEESEPVLSDGAEEEKAGRGVITPSPLISLSGGPVASESPSAPSSSAGLTHDQRVAIAAGIKEMEWGRQWLAGDTANEWEEEMGEDFWNIWANEFGYTYPSLRNNQRTAKAIPPAFRNAALRFSHHIVVADLNREDMEMWLDKCVEEGWSVAEFRRQVKGERPRVKRWTLEELRQRYEISGCEMTQDFIRWLGENQS